MPISTLKEPNKSSTIFLLFLSIAGLVGVIVFGVYVVGNMDVFKKRAALDVSVYYGDAEVYVNGVSVGKTPFSSKDIKPGDNQIKIKSATREYSNQITFIPNQQKYVHGVGIFVDLGTSDTFSEAQETWFEKSRSGEVLKVVSDPANAAIYIDNSEVGKTPFSTDKLSEGEYDLRIDYPGYETQTERVSIKKGYVLNNHFKLFPIPTTANINLLEGATNFYNISLDNPAITADSQAWVNALIYWNKTRGLNLEGRGLNKEQVFDYYIDYKGNLFGANGAPIVTDAAIAALKDSKRSAYLGRISDGIGITQEAKTTLQKVTGASIGGKKVVILETGTGWLRVRSSQGLGGAELARVTVGQKYDVIEEATGWIKIKVSDTVSGWVSADYAKLSE